MGHDITAYLGTADPENPAEHNAFDRSILLRVAFLECGAYSPLRHTLYEVLNATDCDGDVSGIYAQRWFSREQLETAQADLSQRINDGAQVQREMDFVKTCLAELPPNRQYVCISFE